MQESDRGACVRGRGARRGPPPKVFIDMLHEYPARLCAVQPHELCCPMILLELVVSLRLNFRKPPGNGLLAMWIGLLRFAMKMRRLFFPLMRGQPQGASFRHTRNDQPQGAHFVTTRQMSGLLSESLKGIELDGQEYTDLLTKLIGESRHVQNNPRQGLIPNESKVAAHVLELLNPYKKENGGPLIIEELVYKEGRPNLKITYPGSAGNICTGLIGSHMDVVPANPETWNRDPFTLEVEGDKLHGRGTTDCLGHVGMITLLMKSLAERKPALKRSVVALFIAGEEGGETGVGVDMVVKSGKMDEMKTGTAFWIDSADSQPCTGTAGALQWHLKATGRLFHRYTRTSIRMSCAHMSINRQIGCSTACPYPTGDGQAAAPQAYTRMSTHARLVACLRTHV